VVSVRNVPERLFSVRRIAAVGLMFAMALTACGKGGTAKAPDRGSAGKPAPAAPIKRDWPPDPDALPAVGATDHDGPGARDQHALQVVQGNDRWVDASQAQQRGLVLVDLSDDWAPFVFADGVAADGHVLSNRYREIFVGLANDRSDGDGQPLRAGERNFLEPYGIPPSLSVLRHRFVVDGASTCFAQVDRARLLAVDSVATFGTDTEKKERDRAQARLERLEASRADAGAATLDELAAAQPKLAKELAAQKRYDAERAAFVEAEKRLVCDGLLDPSKHAAGRYDTPMRFAMLAFQQKTLVMAQGDISRGTLEALARSPLENDYLALRRVIAERVADAGGFIEDGSANAGPGGASFRPDGPDSAPQPVPDLIGLATTAVLARLNISSPEEALDFFRRRKGRDFRRLRVAARLPAPPPYYAEHMDLLAEIDQGDVWYEFPFDDKGRRLPQPRTRYPSLSLFVRWQGQRIPLLRWRTTVGGWRSELADDGQEYLRYKGSDVGQRVWRNVVAAPVWIPPPSTPLSGFIKEKWVNGAIVKVTNQDETGPGYLSAYGLVAGIHVEPRGQGNRMFFFDNGIRTHGTFDYTSLRGRFSHGCHRLENHLAVRLFSFVLRHRHMKAQGTMALDYRRRFFASGEAFDLRLLSRGFYYELTPPLPVETLAGTVKGTRAKPVPGYVHKPGVVYARKKAPAPGTGPDDRAGGGGAGEVGSP
jgi:hypothetical protein